MGIVQGINADLPQDSLYNKTQTMYVFWNRVRVNNINISQILPRRLLVRDVVFIFNFYWTSVSPAGRR